jgi:anaerobic ribonucleoside-triphosphate reductase activating protein
MFSEIYRGKCTEFLILHDESGIRLLIRDKYSEDAWNYPIEIEMKFTSYDIVFQEVPGEVTLAVNISNCPNRCYGCHSPHLQEDSGEELTESVILGLLEEYGNAVTCICFMGGDGSPDDVLKLAEHVRMFNKKTAWYSGRSEVYGDANRRFDYIKLGRYEEEAGGLDSQGTNQRFYRIENEAMIDMTGLFCK